MRKLICANSGDLFTIREMNFTLQYFAGNIRFRRLFCRHANTDAQRNLHQITPRTGSIAFTPGENFNACLKKSAQTRGMTDAA